MNLEFLKSRNSKIILCVLAVFIIIILIILMLSGSNKENNKLLLTCSVDKKIENILSANQTINLYKTDVGLKLSLNNKMTMLGNLSDYSKTIYNNVVKGIEHEYEYLSNLDYVNYETNYNDDYVSFNVDYNITEESNDKIIAEYNYDFLNSSTEEIKNYFEGDGYKCQKS